MEIDKRELDNWILREPDYTADIEDERRNFPPGKFSSEFDQWLYELSLDGGCEREMGDSSDGIGYFCLIELSEDERVEAKRRGWFNVDTIAAVILIENSDGYVSVELYGQVPAAYWAWSRYESAMLGLGDTVEEMDGER